MANHRAILIVDLAFGDCGKGAIVDYLARTQNARAVVRFNGGPQAGHNVVTPDGRHHTFAQFGSGAFVPGVKTILSRFMLIEPYAMLNEAAHLACLGVVDPMAGLVIDRRCLVITPAQQAANRLREIARGNGAHGTCGMGIGETMQDAIDHPDLALHAADLQERDTVVRKLRAIQTWKAGQLRPAIREFAADSRSIQAGQTLLDGSWIDAAADNYLEVARHATIADEPAVHAAMRTSGTLLFEGAQGVLLDENFGFHPHTTWSNTTFTNADVLLDEAAYDAPRTRLGVLRAYFTRHGPGPFVTEDPSMKNEFPEPHNTDTGWQGRFRVGPFDAVAAHYAIKACGGVDSLAITHLDRLRQLPPHICTAYVGEETSIVPSDRSIDEAFIRSRGHIVDINPVLPRSLEASARRTRAILNCRAVYSEVSTGEQEFIDRIGSELRAGVCVTSGGPTANEKRMLVEV